VSSVTDTAQRLLRSSTLFTQADRLSCALAAALPYRSSRSSDTRSVNQRRSPFSTGGRPLPRFGAFIAVSMYQQINIDNPYLWLVH
jgi:hypothetical protein